MAERIDAIGRLVEAESGWIDARISRVDGCGAVVLGVGRAGCVVGVKRLLASVLGLKRRRLERLGRLRRCR